MLIILPLWLFKEGSILEMIHQLYCYLIACMRLLLAQELLDFSLGVSYNIRLFECLVQKVSQLRDNWWGLEDIKILRKRVFNTISNLCNNILLHQFWMPFAILQMIKVHQIFIKLVFRHQSIQTAFFMVDLSALEIIIFRLLNLFRLILKKGTDCTS